VGFLKRPDSAAVASPGVGPGGRVEKAGVLGSGRRDPCGRGGVETGLGGVCSRDFDVSIWIGYDEGRLYSGARGRVSQTRVMTH